jgi:ABC-type glutathione transport system ATPase component
MLEPTATPESPVCIVDRLTVEVIDGLARKTVVEDVSFQIEKGDYFALVGESGSGKSVTCHTLMNLLPFPAAVYGRIVVDGQKVLSLRPRELRQFRQKSVGIVFQDPMAALNPVRTIGSQIFETLRMHHPKAGRDELRELALAALRSVHINQPEARLTSYPHQLSGGLNQRVMIAFALLGNPPLLIADEPTTALDMSVQAEILDLIDEMRAQRGLSVLMVTHDLGIVGDRATHIAVMKSGRVVERGVTSEVLAAPAEEYTRALFEAASVNHELKERPQKSYGDVCLSFDKVCKQFKTTGGKSKSEVVVAADNVTFSVKQGEIVALVGESGSGKTTAAKMAMGLVKPDSGQVTVNAAREIATQDVGVQIVFQHPKDSLDPLMRVKDQLHEVLMVHGEKDPAARAALIRATLRDVGLSEEILDRRPSYLSGGEAQRVVIARALLLKPRLLIADEPLSAVDVCLQKQILDCFKSLRETRGIAILLITHDLRIVFDIADRVVVMKSGRVVEDVSVAHFSSEDRDAYTRKLIRAIPGRKLPTVPATPAVPGALSVSGAIA